MRTSGGASGRTGGRVSIRDVAREAGVSTTTVSDALGGTGRLAPATRDRVTKVAAELGYAAHPGARWLRQGRTGAIGLSIPDRGIRLDYYMRLALGAADEAFSHGLALTLVPGSSAGGGLSLPLDGIVIADPELDSPTREQLSGSGLPVVTCERDITAGADHAGRAEGDHVAGVQVLLDHLHGQGARRIAVLAPYETTSFAVDVRAGHADWCARHDLPVLRHDVPLAATATEVREAVTAALAETPRPDAVVVVPDGCLAPCVNALGEAGVAYPRDLLLASYVDSPAIAALPVPVTAMDLAPADMGRAAVRLLAELVAGERQPGAVDRLPVTLHVRASTLPGEGA